LDDTSASQVAFRPGRVPAAATRPLVDVTDPLEDAGIELDQHNRVVGWDVNSREGIVFCIEHLSDDGTG
jgi:hypothetical protein